MSEAKAPSFLSTVKAEIDSAFATTYDALSGGVDEDTLATTLVDLKKSLWAIVEKRLKESFTNGKKAAGGSTGKPETARKPNPFRKE